MQTTGRSVTTSIRSVNIINKCKLNSQQVATCADWLQTEIVLWYLQSEKRNDDDSTKSEKHLGW